MDAVSRNKGGLSVNGNDSSGRQNRSFDRGILNFQRRLHLFLLDTPKSSSYIQFLPNPIQPIWKRAGSSLKTCRGRVLCGAPAFEPSGERMIHYASISSEQDNALQFRYRSGKEVSEAAPARVTFGFAGKLLIQKYKNRKHTISTLIIMDEH